MGLSTALGGEGWGGVVNTACGEGRRRADPPQSPRKRGEADSPSACGEGWGGVSRFEDSRWFRVVTER